MYPRWAEYRSTLREVVGDRWRDIPYLLGGWGIRKDVRTGQLLNSPKEKWKPNLEVVKATVRFLERTGRLTFYVTGAIYVRSGKGRLIRSP